MRQTSFCSNSGVKNSRPYLQIQGMSTLWHKILVKTFKIFYLISSNNSWFLLYRNSSKIALNIHSDSCLSCSIVGFILLIPILICSLSGMSSSAIFISFGCPNTSSKANLSSGRLLDFFLKSSWFSASDSSSSNSYSDSSSWSSAASIALIKCCFGPFLSPSESELSSLLRAGWFPPSLWGSSWIWVSLLRFKVC